MKANLLLIAIGILIGFVIGAGLVCQCSRPPAPAHDALTIPLPAVHDTVRVTSVAVRYRDTGRVERIPFPVLQTKIESVLVAAHVDELMVCADTIMRDTLHLCYAYRAQRFTVDIGFVDRVVAVPPPHEPWAQLGYYAEGQIDQGGAIFGGVGGDLLLWRTAQVFGSVGILSSPLSARAFAGLRWRFK